MWAVEYYQRIKVQVQEPRQNMRMAEEGSVPSSDKTIGALEAAEFAILIWVCLRERAWSLHYSEGKQILL